MDNGAVLGGLRRLWGEKNPACLGQAGFSAFLGLIQDCGLFGFPEVLGGRVL